MPTPGLLFVPSHLLPTTNITDDQYNDFYNHEHVPDVLSSGIHGSQTVALRYKNVSAAAPDPYLALYPVEDLSTIWSGSGFSAQLLALTKTTTAQSLGNADITTIAAFAPRIYEKIQAYEAFGREGQTGEERGRTIVCVAMEPGEGVEREEDFEEWYRKQHLDMLGLCRGYRRCTRYRRVDGQTPRFLALHEYDCTPEELPNEQIKQVVGTEWSKRIIAEAKVLERDVYQLIYVGGDAELKL